MSDHLPTEVNPYELSARMVSLEEKLLAAIQIINNNQDKIGDDVAKIKEAVYNPDIGLYARLRVVEDQKKTTPLKRAGTPDDIAYSVIFFCLEGGEHITGETLIADAGMHLSLPK